MCESDESSVVESILDPCGILQRLATMETEPNPERHTHLWLKIAEGLHDERRFAALIYL